MRSHGPQCSTQRSQVLITLPMEGAPCALRETVEGIRAAQWETQPALVQTQSGIVELSQPPQQGNQPIRWHGNQAPVTQIHQQAGRRINGIQMTR